jgi:hypothetical protein
MSVGETQQGMTAAGQPLYSIRPEGVFDLGCRHLRRVR